jgi:hypothetical protein
MFDLPLPYRYSEPDSEGHALTYTSLARYNNERDTNHQERNDRGRDRDDDNYSYYYDHSYNQEQIGIPLRPLQTHHPLPPWVFQYLDQSIHTLVSLRRAMGYIITDDDIIHVVTPALRDVATLVFRYVYNYLFQRLHMS